LAEDVGYEPQKCNPPVEDCPPGWAPAAPSIMPPRPGRNAINVMILTAEAERVFLHYVYSNALLALLRIPNVFS